MKKIYLSLFLVLFSFVAQLTAAPYGLLINGTTKIEASSIPEKDGNDREQFLAACVQLKSGDKVQLCDFGNNDATWMCAVDPYSVQGFSGGKNEGYLTWNTAGTYDFYIKLKYQDDMLYIGPAQNCGTVTPPTPDPNAKYYVTGSEELVGTALAWKENAIEMTKTADDAFTHTFTDLEGGVAYRMKITNGTWEANWGYSAVQNAPIGVAGDTDGNIVFKLATKGNVGVTFNGVSITLQGDFTNEPPVKSSVPAECEDVMLQAFYYDAYQDGAPGDVLINGEQLGHTKWSKLLSLSSEIGSYFDLVWLPPSGKSEGGTGYHQTQYSNQNSAWGSQQELLEFIKRMHAVDTKVVADIVINHAGTKSSWCDFYTQYFGEYGTFEPDASWIAESDEVNFNDEAGDCKGSAAGPEDGGYNGQDNYGSARDWAHAKPEVQNMMKAYLKWMKNVIGFDGWRYDYAQGFKGKYIDMYNSASENYFSVVEFWNNDVSGYLVDANWNTMAFDFGTKYSAIKGIADGDYTKCKGSGLLGAGLSRYAVTFVDSHDTYFGCVGRDNQDEIGGCQKSMEDYNKDRVLGANAFILSMPGVPCVFYPHWVKYKDEIGKMVLARKAAGVHSESTVSDEAGDGYYKSTITGHHGSIRLLLGPNSGYDTTPAGYTLACKGGNFAMYYNTTQKEVPVLSITPTTIYKTESLTVEMSAVALSGTPTIYYTTDGTDPTTSSSKKTYSTPFTVTGTVTVKAYATLNGVNTEVQEATYTYQEPQATPLTVKFMPPEDWDEVYLYAWDNNETILLGGWPGTEWKTKDKEGWLFYIFDAKYRELKIQFNNGSDEKSNDIILDQDACYEWKDGAEVLSEKCSMNIPLLAIYPEGRVFKTETLEVAMRAVCTDEPPTIYYTLDGTDPKEGAGKVYTAPITIRKGNTVTLKAYAKAGSQETEVQTHVYTYEEPQATPITVGFFKPEDWATVYLYSWLGSGDTATKLTGEWPGSEMTNKKENGMYYHQFDAALKLKEVNFIFNDGSGVQTKDLFTDEDVCYAWENKKAVLVDCSGTDVENVETEDVPMLDITQPMYNILGQQVSAEYRGIVIQNGYKFVR